MFNYDMPAQRNRQPSNRDIPVAPLPPIVGNPEQNPVEPFPPSAGPDYPVVPLPPIVGTPVEPFPPSVGPDYPVVPLPPIVGTPVEPFPPSISPDYPVVPLPPIVGIPQPGPTNRFAIVRFLNAAFNFEPLRVYIGPLLSAGRLDFGDLSSSYRVLDGFRTVTVTSADSPRVVLYQQSIPFSADERITLAIVRTVNGLDLVRVSDLPCQNRQRNRACIRAVNLVYNSPALDVILDDGRVVFSDVRYKEVTPFRQARPREYGMYIAQTSYVASPIFSDIQTLEDLPVILANYILPGFGRVNPLTSFTVDARAGAMETIYILGGWGRQPVVLTKVAEDF